jgi:hypothetical protein
VNSAAPVRILGQGFQPGATVTIGGAASNVVVVDSRTITATTPAHAAAAVDVVVTNPDGSSSRLPAGYRYAALEIARVEPAAARSGDHVRIRGAGFAPGASVTIGGVDARILLSDDFSFIETIAPEHQAEVSDVVVTNPNGSGVTLAGGFRFTTITISVRGNPVTAGGDLTVTWVVPAQAEPRKLEEGLVLMNTATGNFHWHSDTSGTDSGTRRLIAPTEPGQYEFQYRDFDDFTPPYYRILGRSQTVTVTAAASGPRSRP